jgi:hypothetical protein
MYSPEIHHLINREQYQDLLREIERDRLLKTIGLHDSILSKLYRKAVGWLGAQMVKWGAKLQNIDPDKGCQESSLKIHVAGS